MLRPRRAAYNASSEYVRELVHKDQARQFDALLREDGRDTLVLMGVATSGCVLSTLRWAADVSYKLAVVRDGCGDADTEVHRVLTEKIFPRQAEVFSADDFAARIGGG